MRKPGFFSKNIYLAAIVGIYLLILISPFAIKYSKFKNTELIEFAILFLLLLLGFCVHYLYRKEAKLYERQIDALEKNGKSYEERIESAFKYIGSVNVQLEELNSIFTKITKYPETKKELKFILTYFTKKIMQIANAQWVLFRVVDIQKIKTLTEVYVSRNDSQVLAESISNISLINKKELDGLVSVSSTDDTFRINTYFIFPSVIDDKQKVMIETVANQAEMLYIIYSSEYYKDSSKLNESRI